MRIVFIIIILCLVSCTNTKRNDINFAKDRADKPIVDFSNFGGTSNLLFDGNQKKEIALEFFREWNGTPYLWGGESKFGIDCSAFIQKMYNYVFNINLPRTTREQMTLGEICDYKDMDFGDLVFFKTGVDTYHVGFYYTNGMFFNSSSSKGVSLGSLDDKYWRDKYLKSIKIVKTN